MNLDRMSMSLPVSSPFVYGRLRRRRRLFGGWVGQSTLVSCYAFSSPSSLCNGGKEKARLCFDLTKMVQQMRNIMSDAVVLFFQKKLLILSSCLLGCQKKVFVILNVTVAIYFFFGKSCWQVG